MKLTLTLTKNAPRPLSVPLEHSQNPFMVTLILIKSIVGYDFSQYFDTLTPFFRCRLPPFIDTICIEIMYTETS